MPTFIETHPECVIDSTCEYPRPDYLLYQNGVGFAAKGNILALKGKAKAGKNFSEALLIASLLGCEKFGLKSGLGKKTIRVIHEDTDQHHYHTALTKQRVQRLLGWNAKENQSELTFVNTRNMDAKGRKLCLLRVIKEEHPDVMILDNALHIYSDFNDPTGSRKFVDELITLADENNCLLMVVLHENKSSGDSNMKGHLGTMLAESASDVFEVVKDGNKHYLKHVTSRDKSIEPITFIINDEGLPQLATSAAMEKKEKMEAEKRTQRNKAFAEILDGGVIMTYGELVSAFCDNMNCGTTKAAEDLKSAVEEEIVTKTDDRQYHLNVEPF